MPVGATGMSLSDAISGYTAGLSGNADKEVKGLEQAKDTYEDRIKSADTEEKGLDPSALKPPALSPPPQPQATQPIQVWGSAAMWMAALGGILTRQPFTNSLKAAGAVMNSYKQADASAAQQAYDSWKTETENATKMAQFSIDAYKTALSKIDSDKKQAASDFTTTAKALGDENAAYVATHYGIDAAVRYVDSMQAHVDRMKEAQPKIDLENEQLQLGTKLLTAGRALQAAQKTGDPAKIKQATEAFQAAQNDSQNFNKATGKGGAAAAGGDFTPKMGQLMAALASEGVSLPAGMRSKAQQVQLYQGILDKYPDKSADEIADLVKKGQIEFGAQKKETQTAAGVAGKVEVAQNEISQFIPLVREASALVPRGNFVPINRLLQTADANISDPNLKALKIYLNSLMNGYDMLAARGGSDVAKREEAHGLLTAADSPEALEVGLKAFQKEADAAHRAAVEATRVPELAQGSGQFNPDASWPSAKGVKNGTPLHEGGKGGPVVARAKDGQWIAP